MDQKQQRGKFYWGVAVPVDVEASGTIWITADHYFVRTNGAVEFIYEEKEGKHCSAVTLAPGKWSMVFAASVVDGSPLALDEIA